MVEKSPVVAPTNSRRYRRMPRPSQRRVHREPFSINSEGVLGRAVSAGWLGWLQHTGRGASLRRAPACRQASQPGRPQSRARSADMSSSVPPTSPPRPAPVVSGTRTDPPSEAISKHALQLSADNGFVGLSNFSLLLFPSPLVFSVRFLGPALESVPG